MKVILNTDNHIQGSESLAEHVDTVVENALGRFSEQVMRVDVHLSDANAGKAGSGDKHCTMEARLEGRPPATANNDADTVRDAIAGAARKLQRVLDSSLGRLSG